MSINKAYLTAGRGPESDEVLTPRYAVEPIVKYLKKKEFKKVWCPFDKEDSQYVRVLRREGFDVIYSHKDEGDGDFFEQIKKKSKNDYDVIVSNPPFSCKNEILSELYKNEKPFAVLLPQNSLQSVFRTDLFIKYGLEYLGFDTRVCFYTNGELDAIKTGNHFASAYFCHGVLEKALVFEKLELVQERY